MLLFFLFIQNEVGLRLLKHISALLKQMIMFKKLPLIALCSLIFTFFHSCTNDVGSFEAGPVASYTYSSSAPVIAGIYVVSRQMNNSNTVTFQVNVTARGKYTVRTATQAGVYFEASGEFTTTGQQSLVLYGKGIPTSAGTYTFSAGSNGSNSFGITILANMPPATFTYAGAPGACSPASVSGLYAAGIAMGAGNYVDLTVNVTTIGSYSISTNSAGGINFFTSGSFSATGTQNVRLTAGGTPSGAGTYSYTPSGGCSFSVTVLPPPPPASFTYTCAAPTISGTFAAGTALTAASTISVPVNVTVPGLYSVTTDNQNGVTFSASGIFSGTGAQVITLRSTNTPTAAGTFTYTPAGAGCTFDITYTGGGGGGGGGGDVLKCTIDGTTMDFSSGVTAVLAGGNFSATGTAGSSSLAVTLTDNSADIAVGTYNKLSATNTNKGCLVTFTPNTASPASFWLPGFLNSNPFTVTVQTITTSPNKITGIFSGDLFDALGANKKVVTNGTFSLTY